MLTESDQTYPFFDNYYNLTMITYCFFFKMKIPYTFFLISSDLINSLKWSQIKVNTCHNLFRHELIINVFVCSVGVVIFHATSYVGVMF